MISFPDLAKDDIEVRVATVKENQRGSGVELLLYKDARVDMRLLDETVGSENWQRKHDTIGGALFCSVGIRCGNPSDGAEWVWKQDCGTAGNFEPEKSSASDAFKRACFNWGIGRELYTAPRVFVWQDSDQPEPLFNLSHNRDGKAVTYDKFSVSQIIIEEKRIVALSIRNDGNGKYVFRWDGRKQ